MRGAEENLPPVLMPAYQLIAGVLDIGVWYLLPKITFDCNEEMGESLVLQSALHS
jgi:hypothetical protein